MAEAEDAVYSADHVKGKISEALGADTIKHLVVEDVSAGCGSKFQVVVVSTAFDGVPLIARQRLVNAALEEEMKTIHALEMKTWTVKQGVKKGVVAEDGKSAE